MVTYTTQTVTHSHQSSVFIMCFVKTKMIQKLTFNINEYLGTLKWANWLKHKVDHSPPSNAKVTNEWTYTSTPIKQKYLIIFNETLK